MIQGDNWQVHIGSNLDVLPTLPDNSVDSIVTDPPYELGFMGKKWDSSGIAYSTELWKECLRVLKPGGHLLSFGGTRTWHRVAVAIEDSGFEVRDSIAWMYGSGFPKSLDISKAIEKALEVGYHEKDSNNPATTEAQQWEGWGTALKPAFEPIVVARKPLIGTVAENVLEHGTGGLNIDGSRIGTDKLGGGTMPNLRDVGAMSKEATGIDKLSFGKNPRPARRIEQKEYSGRWPANVILDPYTAELLDEQSGDRPTGAITPYESKSVGYEGGWGKERNFAQSSSTGGASRFFYVAKASKRDRNEGLDELPTKGKVFNGQNPESAGMAEGSVEDKFTTQPAQNFHPTVKPTALMRYLVKLVTPPGGTVLDPFTGSGSTGKAAILEGFDFIGIELTEDYIPIIEGRLKHAEQMRSEQAEEEKEKLF